MFKDQCISVTDLRTKTKECLSDLNKEPKYIFVNNQPVAVLLDIDAYEEQFMKPKLVELSKDKVSKELMKKAIKAKNTRKEDLVNL